MIRLTRFKIKWTELKVVFRNEFSFILRDAGLVLILIFAILIYSTLYSFAYKNQVLRDIPIGVVDLSQTESSRKLTSLFDASANVNIAYKASSMQEARQLFEERKIYGIVYIPRDYEKSVMTGKQITVSVYVDGSYFLMYRQVLYDVVGSINDLGADIEVERLVSAGASVRQAEVVSTPVEYRQYNLFNPYTGYGTFIMPAIMILIIQQTLLIGIGMSGGTWREFGLYRRLITPGEKRLSTVPIVLGKALAYLLIYATTCTYVFGLHYQFFGFPMNGSAGAILVFLLPYLLSSIFLGIAISTLFRYRENSILFMLWSSIPILLLSGASLPSEAIPPEMLWFGEIFPSTSGIKGFVRMQSMGASLKDVASECTTLWILTGAYFGLACLGIRLVMNKDDVKNGTSDYHGVDD